MPGHKKESALEGIIEAVDFFDGQPELTLRGKRTISSTFGGILTIGIIIFIIEQFTSQCVAMFNYEDPQLVQTNELEEDPAIVTLNEHTNFLLAFQVQVDGDNVDLTQLSPFNWESTVVKILTNADSSTTTTQHPLLWRPCLESDFPESIYGPDIYTTYDMGTAFCLYGVNRTFYSNGTCPEEVVSLYPDCITPPGFNITGTILSDDFEYLQFTATFCNASDLNLAPYIQCDPNMYTKFQSLEVKFVIYYANTVLLPTNHSHPNRTIFDTTYWETGLMMEKFATVYVDRVTVQNYDDFVFVDKYKNSSFYQINDNGIREQEIYFESESTTAPLLQWTICRSNTNLIVTRTYAKVIDYLTDLGGFSKALMFMAGFLAVGYVRHRYQVVIANELFDFELSETTSISPRKSDSVLNPRQSPGQSIFSFDANDAKALIIDSPLSPLSSLSPLSPLSTPSSTLFASKAKPVAKTFSNDETIWEYFKKQKSRRNRLDTSTMGCLRYHLSLLCKKNKTREAHMVDEAKKIVSQELNIATIISKLKDVEMLKTVLLNPIQREAFEYMEKPLIENPRKSRNSRHPGRHLNRLNTAVVNRRPAKSRTLNSTLFDNWKKNRQEKYFKKDFESLPRYEKLYTAYQYLENDRDPSNRNYNKKLLRMMDQDLINVFKRIDMLLQHEPDTDKFDELLKELSEGPKQTNIKNRMQTR